MNGTFAVTYNVDTVALVDANLEDLAKQRASTRHPDVDLLLDARPLVSLLVSIWGPSAGSSTDAVDVKVALLMLCR